jgi:hypothetical protein
VLVATRLATEATQMVAAATRDLRFMKVSFS